MFLNYVEITAAAASADRKGVSFTDIAAMLTQVVKEQQLIEKSQMLQLAVNEAGC
jgi:hypothetical protein